MKRVYNVLTDRRIGERHPRARLTNADVELVRALHDAGLGYKSIAQKFETHRNTIRDICTYTTRVF